MHITCKPEKEVVDGWLNELDGSKVLKVTTDASGITNICWPGLQCKRQGDTVFTPTQPSLTFLGDFILEEYSANSYQKLPLGGVFKLNFPFYCMFVI